MDSEYVALHDRAGFVDAPAGRLLVTGADRRTYLQGLLTNDIEALGPGRGCYAAYLTAQGRMISDLRVFETGDAMIATVEAEVIGSVREQLSRFIFSEDVELADITSTTASIAVYGPHAAPAVAAALGAFPEAIAGLPSYGCVRTAIDGGDGFVLRVDELGMPGFVLVVTSAAGDGVRARLLAAGAVAVSVSTLEACRIESGVPRFGVDMDQDTIPLEAGIEDRAISLTKGCYVGQEIIIRVLHRGHGRVAKRLVGLMLPKGSRVPVHGEALHAGARQVGTVTSAVLSPSLERPIALGYVHRDFVEPGTTIAVGDDRIDARVALLPFSN